MGRHGAHYKIIASHGSKKSPSAASLKSTAAFFGQASDEAVAERSRAGRADS
jgi:hypothetical protein